MSTEQITGTPTNFVLNGTGTYGNPVTIASDAFITGDTAVTAIDIRTIENDGVAQGTTTGIELQLGGTVTNSGRIFASYDYGVEVLNGTGTINNTGSIFGGYDGIYLQKGGSVTNDATA